MNSNTSSYQVQTSLAAESDVNKIYIIVFSTIGAIRVGLIIIATFLFLKKRFSKPNIYNITHTTDQPLTPELSPQHALNIQTIGNIQTDGNLESKTAILNNKVEKLVREENNINFVISDENHAILGPNHQNK